MPKKILIISTNQEISPQPVAPIGAAWVAEALHRAGFNVRLLDLSFERDPHRKIGLALKHFRPDGVGLSVRNLDNGDFLSPRSFVPDLKRLTDFIKENSQARMLIGGSGVSVMPGELLEFLGLDYAVVGDGEAAAVKFFSSDSDPEPNLIPGLVKRGAEPSGRDQVARVAPVDHVLPRMHQWVDVRHYLRYEPVLPVQGKRGCSNRCIYCTYNNIEGRRYRVRDPEEVVEEISTAILKSGAHTFEFVDSIFNQPEGYLERLMEEILRWRLKARFHISSMSPKGLTRAQVKLMERAGVTAVGITPDSASDKMLGSLRKGFGEKEVHNAAEIMKASSINALWCFLLGGPGEDEHTVSDTVRFINHRVSDKDKAFIASGIRIYPGTGMHALALQEGLMDDSDSLLMPSFYFTPEMTPMQLRDTLKSGLNSLGRTIFLSDTHFSALSGLRLIGTAFRLPSPFWRYAGYMNLLLTGNRIINREWSARP